MLRVLIFYDFAVVFSTLQRLLNYEKSLEIYLNLAKRGKLKKYFKCSCSIANRHQSFAIFRFVSVDKLNDFSVLETDLSRLIAWADYLHSSARGVSPEQTDDAKNY